MAPLTAAAVSFVWSWLAPRSRLALLLTDDPTGDDLKVHERPIPPIGGIGIYLALQPALIQMGDLMIWLAANGALALGVLDDRLSIAPRVRLAVELLIGVTLAASPVVESGLVGRFVVAAAAVVLINAINLYDGLDGLAGGALAVSSLGVGVITDSVIAYALSAALLGFLVFNWHPAKLFLGDGGAYLVAVVFVAAAATGASSSIAALLVLLAMPGVVLVDLLVTLIRRSRANAPLFRGDRSHVYDQLLDRGWGVRAVAGSSILSQGLLVAAAVLLSELSLQVTAVVAMSAILLALVGLAAALGFTSNGAIGELS